ncbi:unnamed protein product, partial [marine sediment metagenome]
DRAAVRVGQVERKSELDGSFELPLTYMPGDDDNSVLFVSHDHYCANAIRLDDHANGETIQLEPKRRVTFAAFQGSLSGEPFANSQRAIANAVRNRLAHVTEFELTDEENREQIIHRMFSMQQGRALYDRATLVNVGQFRAATHGVFGWISKPTSQKTVTMWCALVDFRTGETEESSRIAFAEGTALDLATEYLVDQVVFGLCTVKILAPRDRTRCQRRTAQVKGFIQFRPESWKLLVSVKP